MVDAEFGVAGDRVAKDRRAGAGGDFNAVTLVALNGVCGGDNRWVDADFIARRAGADADQVVAGAAVDEDAIAEIADGSSSACSSSSGANAPEDPWEGLCC